MKYLIDFVKMNEKKNKFFKPTKSICQHLWIKPSQVSRQKLQLKLWLIISSVCMEYGLLVGGWIFFRYLP